MTVISISITESSEQIVAGIPKSLTLAVNIPSSIFYTLDGSTPTLFSTIYTGPIFIYNDSLSITFKAFATNGVDSSPIITETYVTNILNNIRLPHSATDASPGDNMPDLYPFGTSPTQPNGQFLNPANAGVTVNNPALTSIGNAFDADGAASASTNQPYNLENYSIKYSTTNAIGQTGHGIGDLPATTEIKAPIIPPETSQQFSNLFDPRALVIFQDFDKEDPNDPSQINKQFFSLEDPETARDGAYFYASGMDAPTTSGSFLRAHYNPRDNTMTHYYFDSQCNKWIISKSPYKPTGSFDGNMANIPRSNKQGSQYIFEWSAGRRRVLF
jgi:hypothetical protein